MVDWRPVADRDTLHYRADMLRATRAFFNQRGVLEVDTPTLSRASVCDPNVESLHTQVDGSAEVNYLHTSPEFPMKRLLAAGMGDIYQICKVFRQGEVGRYHNPEFTLLEWYRTGFDHHDLMNEMEALLGQLAPELNRHTAQRLSYHEAFLQYAGLDVETSTESICAYAQRVSTSTPTGITDKDTWLDWLMGECVAPRFPQNKLTFIYDYPASQAALARIKPDNPAVAERFEVYWGELELANGFHELDNADEQYTRFQVERARRTSQGKHAPPIDEKLIAALHHGLPGCAGVALGLDRLLMASLGKPHIKDVMAFSYEHA